MEKPDSVLFAAPPAIVSLAAYGLRIHFQAEEPPGLDLQWQTYSSRSTAYAKLWMDAYLAAFASRGGHRLVTCDQAYSQFQGLNVLVIRSGTS